jgi:hypothetical protein
MSNTSQIPSMVEVKSTHKEPLLIILYLCMLTLFIYTSTTFEIFILCALIAVPITKLITRPRPSKPFNDEKWLKDMLEEIERMKNGE